VINIKEILRKCQVCDSTNEQSIDIKVDDYISVINGKSYKFYHTDCYKKKLFEKGLDSTIIDQEIQYIKNLMIKNEVVSEVKDKFFYKIMDIYNLTILPKPYYLRTTSIVNGTYGKMKEPIGYLELFEMISNPKFIAKLERIALEKNIKLENGGRLYWDLAIILNEYDNYKKAKIKQQQSGQYVEDEIIKQIRLMKTKTIIKSKDNDTNINIYDLID
jgi:hypothetical protein